MNKIIRVLQINNGDKVFGGGSAFLVNLYQAIDKTKIQFDFLTPNHTTFNSRRELIESMGGHIYEFNVNQFTFRGLLQFLKKLNKFLKDRQYDIVHVNTSDTKFGCACVAVAKACGVKAIFHSHSSSNRKGLGRIIIWPLKWFAYWSSDLLLACSMDAAYSRFPRSIVEKGKVHIIKNGIDTGLYAYNTELRNQVRNELGLENTFVIGHVGRFSKQKNHSYILKIFKEFQKMEEQSILMLIGEGELEDGIKEQAKQLGIIEKVLFLGYRDDTFKYYQAMDAFLFPSLYEGFGIVLLEAQASGLPCFINKDIPNEVDITELIHRLPINVDPTEWCKAIISNTDQSVRRRSRATKIEMQGYSIQSTATALTELYENLLN